MRILVCGDRGWTDINFIKREVSKLKEEYGDDLFICTGGASGVDAHVSEACRKFGIDQVIYPSTWNKDPYRHGIAGPLRNQRMLNEFRPDMVIAIHKDIENSKGTKHMVGLAQEADIPVTFLNE